MLKCRQNDTSPARHARRDRSGRACPQWLRSDKRRRRRGLATVEMALVLPILLLLVLGIIEYGWMFVRVQQMTAAAHAGARAGALNGGTAIDAQEAVATRLVAQGFGNNYNLALTPDDPGSLDRGEAFTVTVTVEYASVAALGIALIPTPDTLTARSTIAREGP